MSTLDYTDTLTVIDCSKCGITFAVPERWRADRRKKHDTFYCPNGDPRYYPPPGTSDTEKLRRKLANTEESLRIMEATAETERRSAAAYKGHITRLKNRVGKGKCPACSTEFPNIAEHMAHEHPGYGDD